VSTGARALTACLDFFDVPDLDAWYARYSRPLEMAAFRTSASFDSQIGSVAAWLRKGEIESTSIECKPWDADGFAAALSKIRPLTRKRNTLHFLPELVRLCANSGVAVAIVRTPAGCRASGSTRFITPTKALLMLSFRYLSDDHFWFTFFHEAGHLLLHGKKALFIEGDTISSTEETQANEFSARLLVPAELESELKHLPIDRLAIRRFAKTVGVSPGIVLGQLQYRGLARQNQLNSLKTRFKWSKKSD
jgi:HTH-type transcriptional regulator / antitoxin HigA